MTLRKPPRHGRSKKGRDLPPVLVVRVTAVDEDGTLVAAPVKDGDAVIRLRDPRAKLGVGDHALVRLDAAPRKKDTKTGRTATLIKPLPKPSNRVIGVIDKRNRATHLIPADKKAKRDFSVDATDAAKVEDGDLVVATLDSDPKYGLARVRIAEVIGRADDPRAASLIAIATHGIPIGFSDAVIAAATASAGQSIDGEDLRHLPLLTIDPADARDHDDAVCAIADDDPKNPGGWVVWSAIADVARYVRPGSEIDAAARDKGVSTYFPDRVEPMLPEALSNEACSLKPDVERACLAMRMVFDARGRKRGHSVHRGIMRSRAKLSYEQAQTAFDGTPDAACAPVLAALGDLWAAYQALAAARDARAPLDIDSPERKVLFGADGHIREIVPKQRLEAHRLIEEMMIQSNVCAAESLEQARLPLIYRIHDMPSGEKLLALAETLKTFDLKWNMNEPATPKRFNALKTLVAEGQLSGMLNEVVLRTQSQAIYSPDNIGHFGLNLMQYAHFTSPIRRYADLIVHRALIRAYKLGPGGLTDGEMVELEAIAEQITRCERRSVAAERDALDRYLAHFMRDHIGARFTGVIVGVTRSALFVRLNDTGADGIIPASRLPHGFDVYDTLHAAANRHGKAYRLGDAVHVVLLEAAPVTGGLMFAFDCDPPSQIHAPRAHMAPKRHGGYRQHARRR